MIKHASLTQLIYPIDLPSSAYPQWHLYNANTMYTLTIIDDYTFHDFFATINFRLTRNYFHFFSISLLLSSSRITYLIDPSVS